MIDENNLQVAKQAALGAVYIMALIRGVRQEDTISVIQVITMFQNTLS